MKRYVREFSNDFYSYYKSTVANLPSGFPGAPLKNVERAVYMAEKGFLTDREAVRTILLNWEAMDEYIKSVIQEGDGCS